MTVLEPNSGFENEMDARGRVHYFEGVSRTELETVSVLTSCSSFVSCLPDTKKRKGG